MPTQPRPGCWRCRGHGTIAVHSYSIDAESRRMWEKAAAQIGPTPCQTYYVDCPQCHGRSVQWISGADGGLFDVEDL